MLFAGENTETEKKRLQSKKQILELALQHKNLDEKLKVDGYVMPENFINEEEGTRDRKSMESVLAARYDEKTDESMGMSFEQKV